MPTNVKGYDAFQILNAFHSMESILASMGSAVHNKVVQVHNQHQTTSVIRLHAKITMSV